MLIGYCTGLPKRVEEKKGVKRSRYKMCSRLCRPKYLHGNGYDVHPTTTYHCFRLVVSDLETVYISRKKCNTKLCQEMY